MRTRIVVAAAITALMIVCLAALVRPVPARAQEGRAARWEYCRVGLGQMFDEGKPVFATTIVYYTMRGPRTERVESPEQRSEDSDARVTAYEKAMTRLGSDGWEAWARDERGTTYLKRRIQ